jgi:putative zinc finger protein
MSHLTDDDLILRFYGELTSGEAARVDSHLRTCSSCHDAWMEIGETLKLVDAATVPEPPPGFERVIWAKVQPALPQRRASFWSWRQLVPIASLAAVVLLAVTLSYRAPGRTPAAVARPEMPPMVKTATAADLNRTSERVLLTALDGHFEQTELLLVELLNAPDGAEFGYERTTADDLLAFGRLYRITAEQIGKQHLAAMLEDLEPVLVEVARSPEKVNRKARKSLRSQIDDEGLLFKVRAVTNEIRERQQEIITTHEGSL